LLCGKYAKTFRESSEKGKGDSLSIFGHLDFRRRQPALAIEKGLRKCGIDVLQGYGITECSPLISVNRNQASRVGSSGPVIPGMEVKLDRKGAIWVRGDGVMKGYYKNPELTDSVFDGNGLKPEISVR